MPDMTNSKRHGSMSIWRRWVIGGFAAAMMIGATLPAVSHAHWVYTAASYDGGQEWAIHSPQGWGGWATTWAPTHGTMYGYYGTGYNIAVITMCQNSGWAGWIYGWKSSPDQYHTAINAYCPSGDTAQYTYGAISE
jgi:homospermidine synthase